MSERCLEVCERESPTLSIIVVSYNTREMTVECLKSVERETTGIDYELIVVDNASTDGSAEAIAAEVPSARLIASPANLGFAAANNLAAKDATGELILLLNPDTVVLDDAIGRLVRFAQQHPEAQLWGGRTLLGDGTLDPGSCWRRCTVWSQFCISSGLSSVFKSSALFNAEGFGDWKVDSVRNVDIVTGCLLLIPNAMWRKLNGFDPVFFMYGEDADLCLRAQALGARPMITPDATIVHYGGASDTVRADKLVKILKARVTLINRYWGPTERLIGPSLLLALPLTRIVGFTLAQWLAPSERSHAQLAAWREVWRRRGEWLKGFPAVAGSVGQPLPGT